MRHYGGRTRSSTASRRRSSPPVSPPRAPSRLRSRPGSSGSTGRRPARTCTCPSAGSRARASARTSKAGPRSSSTQRSSPSTRMSDESFLVTGALGCIGAWTCVSLARQGTPVIAYDLGGSDHRLRLIASPEELDRIVFVEGDVTDLDALEHELAEHDVSHVIHLAALQVPFCKADPLLGAQVNVVGTINDLDADAGDARGRPQGALSHLVRRPDAVPLCPRRRTRLHRCRPPVARGGLGLQPGRAGRARARSRERDRGRRARRGGADRARRRSSPLPGAPARAHPRPRADPVGRRRPGDRRPVPRRYLSNRSTGRGSGKTRSRLAARTRRNHLHVQLPSSYREREGGTLVAYVPASERAPAYHKPKRESAALITIVAIFLGIAVSILFFVALWMGVSAQNARDDARAAAAGSTPASAVHDHGAQATAAATQSFAGTAPK